MSSYSRETKLNDVVSSVRINRNTALSIDGWHGHTLREEGTVYLVTWVTCFSWLLPLLVTLSLHNELSLIISKEHFSLAAI